MKKLIIGIAAVLALQTAEAQCRSYSKRKCRPQLGEFVHDGKLNVAVMFPGDKGDMMLTFYAGQEYRLLMCAMPLMGNVAYKVMDTDKNVLFESTIEEKPYLDFSVETTQQLMVQIEVPHQEEKAGDIVYEGCVSVMVGLKED